MSNIIKPIQACESFFKTGKIFPITVDLPSFCISEKLFKSFVLDTVEEKFRMAEDGNGGYNTHAIAALTSSQNPYYNQEAIEISKKTIVASLCYLSQNKLSQLSNDEKYIALSNTSEQLGHLHSKNEFAASLLMIKKTFAGTNYYERVMDSLETHYDNKLLTEIKKKVSKPEVDIVHHIYNKDAKFALEHFPQQAKQIVELEKPIFLNNQRLI